MDNLAVGGVLSIVLEIAKKIFPNIKGPLMVHGVVFVVALVISILQFTGYTEGLKQLLTIWGSAIGTYEILLKRVL